MRIHFSQQESDGKLADVGVGGRIGILIFVFSESQRSQILSGSIVGVAVCESYEISKKHLQM